MIDTAIDFDHLTPGEPLICEDVQPVNLRRLASVVIEQAIRDLCARKGNPLDRLAVFLWLTGPEFECWKVLAGADHLDLFGKVLPNLREVAKKARSQNDRL